MAGDSWRIRSLPHLLLPPPQDWQEIVSLYEKENTYLGKAALAAGRLWRALGGVSVGGVWSPNWDEDGMGREKGRM